MAALQLLPTPRAAPQCPEHILHSRNLPLVHRSKRGSELPLTAGPRRKQELYFANLECAQTVLFVLVAEATRNQPIDVEKTVGQNREFFSGLSPGKHFRSWLGPGMPARCQPRRQYPRLRTITQGDENRQ
jgi:hypothetical protein